MEDNFKVRVDKTFGTLTSSSSSSQPIISSSLWSLTDEELQKNQWTREPDDPLSDDDDKEFRNSRNDAAVVDRFFLAAAGETAVSAPAAQNPNPNSDLPNGDSGKEMQDDLDELDEYLEEIEKGEYDVTDVGARSGDGREGGEEGASSSRVSGGNEDGDDEFDVRNSIGLDPALDFEEEEGAYDKVAVGREEAGPRLYMSDATDYACHVDSFCEYPTTFKEVSRDPRANHLAAELRLKEDAEAAKNFNSLHVSEESYPGATPNDVCNDGTQIKSILKRKEDQMESKSEKRVRFDSSCKSNDGGECEAGTDVASDSFSEEISWYAIKSSEHQQSSLIPDYIQNPGKYTHYTFDLSSDMNEESNRQAYADFLGLLKKFKQSELDETPADLSKPVVFNSKKKHRDPSAVTISEADRTMDVPVTRKRPSVGIVVGNELESEMCEMEIDEQSTASIKVGSVKRTGRQYRPKQSLEYDDYEP